MKRYSVKEILELYSRWLCQYKDNCTGMDWEEWLEHLGEGYSDLGIPDTPPSIPEKEVSCCPYCGSTHVVLPPDQSGGHCAGCGNVEPYRNRQHQIREAEPSPVKKIEELEETDIMEVGTRTFGRKINELVKQVNYLLERNVV